MAILLRGFVHLLLNSLKLPKFYLASELCACDYDAKYKLDLSVFRRAHKFRCTLENKTRQKDVKCNQKVLTCSLNYVSFPLRAQNNYEHNVGWNKIGF